MTETEQLLAQAQPCAKEFQEPYTGDIYDRPYSAMAANPYANEFVKEHGKRIKAEFAKLFEYPPAILEVPDDFKSLLVDNYIINVERRRMINFENFAKWRQDNPVANELIEPAVKRVEEGRAEMGDVLDVGLFTDLSGGLEVGRITHPYGQRIEHVPIMRMHVAAAIHERGGELEPVDNLYRSLKIEPKTNEFDELTGFIVRYKHDIGFIEKQPGEVLRIAERQVAVYRTDEASGFPSDIIQAMNAAKEIKNQNKTKNSSDYFDWTNYSDERFTSLLESTGCHGFVERIVQSDEIENFIVPESTTIFCYTEKAPINYLETRRNLAAQALRTPDTDNGIAFFGSSSNRN